MFCLPIRNTVWRPSINELRWDFLTAFETKSCIDHKVACKWPCYIFNCFYCICFDYKVDCKSHCLHCNMIRYEDSQHGNLKSSKSGGIELLLRTRTGLIHSRVIKNARDKGGKPTSSLSNFFCLTWFHMLGLLHS